MQVEVKEDDPVIEEVNTADTTVTSPEESAAEKPLPWFKRKKVIIAGLIVAVLMIIGAFVMMSGDSVEAPTTDDAAQTETQKSSLAAAIGLIEGKVEHSVNGEDWESAEQGATVAEGESIRTGADGRVVLLLDDGSAVRLDNNSETQLTTIDSKQTDLKLESGQVYSRVIKSDSRVFAISTDTERFIAKGTAYKTSTDEEMDTLEVYHSTVEVESENKDIEEGNQYDTDSKKKSNIDLDKLKNDEFVQWNKDQDSKDSDFRDDLGVLDIDTNKEDEENAPEETNEAIGIVLSGSKASKGVSLNWSINGTPASDGFKVVYSSSSPTPTYGVHDAQYVGPGTIKYTVDIADGKTYNFRVCAYKASNSTCGSYSNTVTVAAPLVQKEVVVAGTVALQINDSAINWMITGTAPHGFKVVLSKSENPTYPANSIQYVGPNNSTAELPEKSAGTYYVRVCKYTADANIHGGCTDYSNQIEYIVPAVSS